MNIAFDKHKFLAIIYLILAFCWVAFIVFPEAFQFYELSRTLLVFFIGMLGILFFLSFSLMHWKVSNIAAGILREKLFVLFSFFNTVFLVLEIWLFGWSGDGGIAFYYPLPFILIASVFTVLFGVTSIFKINRKALLWVFFTTVLIIPTLYFIGLVV